MMSVCMQMHRTGSDAKGSGAAGCESQVDLSKRLGCMAGGVADIKAHGWFRDIDWDAAVACQLPPPSKCVPR